MKRVLCVFVWGSALAAEDPAFFEAKIRPVLVKRCYECHSTESGKSKGGLLLDTRAAIRAGGESGPAVVPGDPARSLLFGAIQHADPDLQMPPKGPQMPAEVIAEFEAWIKAGAFDPREAAVEPVDRPPVDVESGRRFWSYRRPVKTTGTVDGFIEVKLKEAGLEAAPEAEPGVLLRRLHFDLAGLPPSPEEARVFSMDQWEATVDELLKSPRFGERWGRHWLDVARYAESNGRESNLTFPHAWRYRDYVIDAMNADIPFDRFIAEQVAGDLLPAKDDAERARLLTATGFLALGAKGLNEQNRGQFAADMADEQLDTVTRAVMASSIACARCHDHKTEPFSMEDYYGLAGIFKSTETFYGNWIDSENNNHGHLIRLPDIPGQTLVAKPLPEARVRQLKADLARLNAEERAQSDYIEQAKAEGRDISGEFNRLIGNALRILWTRGGVQGALEAVDELGRPLPLCMGVKEAAQITDSPVYERGEIAHPGQTVPRGFPRIFAAAGPMGGGESGRLELAKWLTSRENPLTARVMANRVWRHLLGAGLVRTVDNFGFSGERPSHPELLDYLAVRFMDGGWSVKRLVKEVVMSKTYRQASGGPPESDPDNRLLSRANRRRLDAEVIRDSMLAVSGRLDTSRRPGSLVAELEGQSVSLMGFNAKLPPDLDGSSRRSIYLPVIRDHLPDVLEQFDVANPNMVTGDREVTNVPLQALYLLNGPFVQEQATALARRLLNGKSTGSERIERAFSLCFSRRPDAREMQLAGSFFQVADGDEMTLMAAFCQSLFSSAEFCFAD
jgi:hypothetical protein